MLAIAPDSPYENGEATLEPGDLLALYTDGVTEAFRCDREEFGEQRLAELLTATAPQGVDEICRIVVDTVEEYRAHEHQDDVTVLMLRRRE